MDAINNVLTPEVITSLAGLISTVVAGGKAAWIVTSVIAFIISLIVWKLRKHLRDYFFDLSKKIGEQAEKETVENGKKLEEEQSSSEARTDEQASESPNDKPKRPRPVTTIED